MTLVFIGKQRALRLYRRRMGRRRWRLFGVGAYFCATTTEAFFELFDRLGFVFGRVHEYLSSTVHPQFTYGDRQKNRRAIYDIQLIADFSIAI